MRPQLFKEKFLHSDVLCLQAYWDYIIAGIGNWVYVYRNFELESKIKIFEGERIHDICAFNSKLILKGCKEVAIGNVTDKYNHTICWQNLSKLKCKDWVQDLFFDEQARLIVLSTAHNVIEVWNEEGQDCLQTFHCQEKCILYSARFVGNSLDNFVLLCGTVFSEIVIWAPCAVTEVEHPVLHRLKGHNGVIFSITVDIVQKIICTTSDDRSLRIWSVRTAGPLGYRHNWIGSVISLIHTLYGHAARVWKSLILPGRVITVGEDSKLCVWSSKSGKLENGIHLHQKAGIRALSSSSDVIVTGGEDGGVTLLTSFDSSTPSCKLCYQSNNGLPKKVFLRRGEVVCVTDQGTVLQTKGEELIQLVPSIKGFADYCVVEASTCKDYLVLGSVRGRVLVLRIHSGEILLDERLVNSRILSMHWLQDTVIVCTEGGLVTIFKVNFLTDSRCLVKERELILPYSKERWTTSALLVNDLLLLGDRMGSLHVYSKDKDPTETFTRLHGYRGVTDIVKHGNDILTSGRDGFVKRFRLGDRGLVPSLTHRLPMEWAWKIAVEENGDDVLVLGFSSAFFTVSSLRRRDVLLRFECGGAHRSCDYDIRCKNLTFAYVKDKLVHLSRFALQSSSPLRNGYHGKNINCLRFLAAEPVIVVTGSEDNTVRISQIDRDDLETVCVLENHISSVKDVAVRAASESVRLILTAGGRGQISVHRFDVRRREYQLLANGFLMDRAPNAVEPSLEGETRVTCLDSTETETGLVLFAGCSDRRVCLLDGNLSVLTTITYTHCILKLKCIRVGFRAILATAATDGRVAFWDVTNVRSVREMNSIKIHQSGINSLRICELKNGKFILMTGGDDNMLAATLFCLNGFSVEVVSDWKNTTTHSGQITGIEIIDDVVLTASTDQRLTIWRLVVEEDRVSPSFVDQYVTSVPDVQGLEVTRYTDHSLLVALCGKGVDFVEVDTTGIQKPSRPLTETSSGVT